MVKSSQHKFRNGHLTPASKTALSRISNTILRVCGLCLLRDKYQMSRCPQPCVRARARVCVRACLGVCVCVYCCCSSSSTCCCWDGNILRSGCILGTTITGRNTGPGRSSGATAGRGCTVVVGNLIVVIVLRVVGQVGSISSCWVGEEVSELVCE